MSRPSNSSKHNQSLFSPSQASQASQISQISLPQHRATPSSTKPIWATSVPPLNTPDDDGVDHRSPTALTHLTSSSSSSFDALELQVNFGDHDPKDGNDPNGPSGCQVSPLVCPSHNLLSVVHDPSVPSPSYLSSISSYFTAGSPQYAPETDETTIMLSQRGTLPPYLLGLDVSSVEAYVNGSGDRARNFDGRKIKASGAGGQARNGNGTGKGNGNGSASGSGSGNGNGMVKSYGDYDAAIRHVPSCFFSPDFSLLDPAVFSSQLVPESLSPSNLASMMDRQETLTQYLDLVEVSLLKQIKSRSSDFFRETTRFQELKQLVKTGADELKDLR